MKNIDVNIVNAVVYGCIKYAITTKKCLIDCDKNKIENLYNLSILYLQHEYLMGFLIDIDDIDSILDDIIINVEFLERIKQFIEKTYNCCIENEIFEEIVQDTINIIKIEIR